MNKKFSTLVASLLLASSLPVAAQFCPQDGEVPYRTRMVKAATLDATFKDVNKINENYWYQLQVDPASLGIKNQEKEQTDYVLTVERDYSTGKLYLTAQPITKATLTHSLWQIKTPSREVNGRRFAYVNKETGFELTFDHTNAVQAKGTNSFVFNESDDANNEFAANYNWNYEHNGLMDGCNTWWSWYTTEDQSAKALDYKKVYSYFHDADSVMYLQAVQSTHTKIKDRVYPTAGPGAGVVAGLSGDGLDGTAANGYAVIAVKDSRANAGDFLNTAGSNQLAIRPVVAGAKVLNAAEINTMIDADGSFLSFETDAPNKGIIGYDAWAEATAGDKAGKATKFVVNKPGTKEALSLNNNPFDNTFVAKETGDSDLKREANYSYSGYEVLFETKDPIQTAGDQKQYGYLYVSEYPYEGQAFQGIYNGLEVTVAPYAYLSENKTKKNYALKYDDEASYVNGKATVKDDALQARYHWKVTYYATNDSVVFEPLNASRMSQSDATMGKKFEETELAKATATGKANGGANGEVQYSAFLNTVNAGIAYPTAHANTMFTKAAGVPVALYAMNFGDPNADKVNYLTVGYASGVTLDGKEAVEAGKDEFAAVKKEEKNNPAMVTNGTKDYQSAMELVVRFDNSYTYLQRATMPSGVYFINLQTGKYSTAQTENRTNGAYVVADMDGHVVYDVAQDEQNFAHMPATQWVVEQRPCEVLSADGNVNYNKYATVSIHNREFANEAFAGQLYENDGKYYIIDHRHYGVLANKQNVDHHNYWFLNCADTVVFNKLDTVSTLGYLNKEENELRENVYQFQNIFNMGAYKFLGITNVNADIDTLTLVDGAEGAEFELFRSEGWYPVAETKEIINDKGEKETVNTGTYKFAYADSLEYGYPSEKAGAPQLYKTFYKVKLKDANLIDNDHKFVALNNQHKYVVAKESEINDPKNQLTFAVVTLKENNEINGEHCYAFVNAERYQFVKDGATEADLTGLSVESAQDEYGEWYVKYYKMEGDKKVVYATTYNDNSQSRGKLVIEGTTLDAKVADLCETTTSVFTLTQANRPLYLNLANTDYADVINNSKKAIDIRTIDAQGNESLYEDSHSAEAVRWDMNYLGAENLGDPTKNEGLYVDYVQASNARMPQYLFAVAADSVPAYKYCNETFNGQPKHGVNPGCGHTEDFAGYVEGRFLVNYNDSVQAAKFDKQTNADKYKHDGYTRLGFVEAVHRGDSLYILKAPYTLASIKVASEDAAENGKLYIRPDYLSVDSLGKVYDLITLDGKHNNVAFSLRNTGDAENSFLIESNDAPAKDGSYFSGLGSFAGAWVKIINGAPVLAKFYDANGNHNTGDSTDAWKNQEDWTAASNNGELINQGARFVFSTVDKDANATANEEIDATAGVSVIGGQGVVTIKGAAGKKVVINNILGKNVANVVLTSDNETIAVPAGIVVVAVEGDEAAKVIVK